MRKLTCQKRLGSFSVAAAVVGAAFLTGCPEETPKPPATSGAPSQPAAQPASGAATKPSTPPAAPAPEPGDLPAPADVAAAPADAAKTPSGLASKVLQAGTGTEHPAPQDTVEVHYTGWMTNGKMFDSSVKRGTPAKFPLDGVIPGWTEGVQLMVVGEKRRFWIPGKLAYGEEQRRPGMPFGTLVFDVELISIKPGPKPIPAPADVAAPPKDAAKTPSGLSSKLLQKGTGKEHPSAEDTVQVHYTGWTTDGKMFDSSVVRGEPTSFPLKGVIKGWTEGVQLMVAGEKRRFWIPGELAYGEKPSRPGAPAGMLVFDIELLNIKQAPKPIPAPADVAAAPKDAKKTASGIAYKVQKKGTGATHPTAASRVEVHYTGWTTDGKMFDSSVMRGEPTQFPLQGVIPGWTEGVQLMVEGEKTRFWIPGNLAYGEKPSRPGAPAGMLVFDIELLKILP